MTEDQQPVWVESDGVSNLPPKDAVGVYKTRLPSDRVMFSYFNGSQFCSMTFSKESAIEPCNSNPTRYFEDRIVDAWWDYQGLMAKPQAKASVTLAVAVKIATDKWVALKDGELASDAVGIHRMAERNKRAPESEKVVVGGLTIDMRDLVEFLKTKQSKPEPNTTPRGILTVWNESADHRLGMWNGNFAD